MQRCLRGPELLAASLHTTSSRRHRRSELEGSSFSESSSRVDESSPPRDSPSLESSDSEEKDSDSADEFVTRRLQQRGSRSSMPDREIDEEDTTTAELQLNLRKISGRSFIPSLKLSSEEPESDTKDRKSRSLSVEERAQDAPSPEGWRPARRSQEREVAEEREVVKEDTVTAEFQTHLRKLSSSTAPVTTPESESGEAAHICQPVKEASVEAAECESTNTSITMEQEDEPIAPLVSRAALARKRGGKGTQQRGLQRSRTWQGFGSSQRYESVSDAGLPPPPPTPAPAPAPAHSPSGVRR